MFPFHEWNHVVSDDYSVYTSYHICNTVTDTPFHFEVSKLCDKRVERQTDERRLECPRLRVTTATSPYCRRTTVRKNRQHAYFVTQVTRRFVNGYDHLFLELMNHLFDLFQFFLCSNFLRESRSCLFITRFNNAVCLRFTSLIWSMALWSFFSRWTSTSNAVAFSCVWLNRKDFFWAIFFAHFLPVCILRSIISNQAIALQIITDNEFCIVHRATAQWKTWFYSDYGVAEAPPGF
jgi:hypothetical protein